MTDPTVPNPAVPGEKPPVDHTTRNWWIAGGATAVVAVIAIVGLIISSGEGDDSSVVVDGSTTSSSSTTLPSTSTSATSPVVAPSVAEFNAAPSPVTCSGSSETVTINWQTRDAVDVVIEIDSASQTDSLPPNGSRPLPFTCNAAQHTYTLVVNGNGGQQTRQDIVVKGVAPPTTPPTQPPTTQPPTTQPPLTTTSGEGPTTTTTKPVNDQAAVDVSDDGTPDGPMTLTIDPTSSDGGKITFTVENTGTQNHSFLVLKTDTPFDELPVDPDTNQVSEDDKVGEINKIKPGKTKKLKLDLEPGNYVVLDNLPGHYAQGARAAFVVILP